MHTGCFFFSILIVNDIKNILFHYFHCIVHWMVCCTKEKSTLGTVCVKDSSKDNQDHLILISGLNPSCSLWQRSQLIHPPAESCSGSNRTRTPGDLLCPAATLELGQPVKTSTCWLLGSRTFPSSFWPHPHPLCTGQLVPTLPFCSRHHCSPTLPPTKGPVGNDLTK